jgi:aryl-alcohol dehydrogenase-like predicted oxidoreductase
VKIRRKTFLEQSSLAVLGLAISNPVFQRMFAATSRRFEGDIPKRTLGKTQLNVTIIGLGGWHMGRLKDEKTAADIISLALDLGINFFDTAHSYQDGVSEQRYGKVLKGRRDKFYLMSKSTMRTKDDARKELEQSLKNLQTDHLDLWQFHSLRTKDDVEQIFGVGGAYETALKAKEEGKIRHIGITGHYDPYVNLEALKHHDLLETMQMPINLVDPHSTSFVDLVLPKAVEHGLGVLAMKTVANGRIVDHNIATAHECLTFAWNLPVSLIVSGVDTPDQLAQNVKTAQSYQKLTEKDKSELLEKSKGSKLGEVEYYKKQD